MFDELTEVALSSEEIAATLTEVRKLAEWAVSRGTDFGQALDHMVCVVDTLTGLLDEAEGSGDGVAMVPWWCLRLLDRRVVSKVPLTMRRLVNGKTHADMDGELLTVTAVQSDGVVLTDDNGWWTKMAWPRVRAGDVLPIIEDMTVDMVPKVQVSVNDFNVIEGR